MGKQSDVKFGSREVVSVNTRVVEVVGSIRGCGVVGVVCTQANSQVAKKEKDVPEA